MKTTLEIIDRLPVGSVVPKTILARMKRAGVIDSYSLWGYLDGRSSDMHGILEYKGRFFKKKYLDGCFYPYLIKADIVPQKRKDYEQFKGDFGKVVKKDMLLTSACAIHSKMHIDFDKWYAYYLHKESVIGERVVSRVRKDVREPSMCLWGAII